MFLFYFIALVILTMLTNILFGTILKVNMLFNISWCVFGGLSTLGLYGLYKPEYIIHLYVIVCIVIFNAIYFIISKLKYIDKTKNKELIINSTIGKPNYLIIYLLNSICLIYSSFFIPKAWMIINNYGYGALRTYAFKESSIYASTTELTVFQTVVFPIIIATSIILAIDISLKRAKKILIFITIINVLVYTFLFAGRMTLIQFMSFIFIALFILNRKSVLHLIMKNKKYIFFSGILFIIVNYLTSERTNSTSSIFEQIYFYLSAPFIFFSNLNKMGFWENNLLYGKAIFGFILGPLDMFGVLLFNKQSNSAAYIITSITADSQLIGDGITFNALTTMLFPFMMDFGKLGIIIGPAIFALLIAFVEYKYKVKYSLFWISLFIYIIYYIPFTVMNYYFLHSATGFVILFLLIFTQKITVRSTKSRFIDGGK